ncbi:hypothetical protein ANCCEY_06425 [Ancylostoma ceylanicum]|uniref:Uncharacterized protein n=1 Tax=Ancylostoma ceylanicum TaxID=53326 RepID=A0A0D6M3K3_9BILA|nr:hypothetical protein ANCCEY_06425 [Ancylostoma ceylanicum]
MCDVRAQKSGIALEAQKKIHGKYDRELAVQILEWVKLPSAMSRVRCRCDSGGNASTCEGVRADPLSKSEGCRLNRKEGREEVAVGTEESGKRH